MQIRKAVKEDFRRIMDIYAYARDYMKANGNPKQWGATNWPPEELILADIAAGKCHVCVQNGNVVGVFYYDFGDRIDCCYDRIEEGAWIGDDVYGVVHRIASDGSTKGVGSYCIRWAIEKSGHLRMDTHPDNQIMQNLLTKLGFTKCGIIHVQEDNDPRFAYEVIL